MATLNREQLKTLKAFRANGYPVISAYWMLKHRPNDVTLLELKSLMAVGDEMRMKWRDQINAIEQDMARVYHFAAERQTHASSAKAMAVFASGPVGFWQVHELNAPVMDRVVIAESPFVRPLVRLTGEQQPYEIVLADHTCARFFLWRDGNVDVHGEMFSDVPREDEIHRMSEDQFQHHQHDWQHKHVKATSEQMLAHLQAQNFKGLWVGAKEDVARALETSVHSYVKEKWCGQFPIDVHANQTDLRERVTPLIEQHEQQLRANLLQRIETAAKSGGSGAIGLDDTLTEYQFGRVMTLLIERNYVASGGRCTNCNSLTLNADAPCPYCSSIVTPVNNLLDELAEDAFIGGAEVIFVPADEGLDKLGHVGALLRFG